MLHKLVDHLKKYDFEDTDIFVVEAGSDPNNLSRNFTWYANWEEADIKDFGMGENELWAKSTLKENKFEDYDAFFTYK